MSQAGPANRRRDGGTAAPERGEILLRADGFCVGYGPVPVVKDLDLEVHAGEIVALLGANGAGKTTTILGLAGELTPTAGSVEWLGKRTRSPLHVRSRQGLGLVPEERSVIFGLNVMENLRLGGGDIDVALTLFPELVPLRKRRAGLLSGGEQQILTLARALSRSPKVLLADELSLGLAPLVVLRLIEAVTEAASRGVGVLLVEQQVRTALLYAHRAYVLQRGVVALQGKAQELIGRIDAIEATYLTATGETTPQEDSGDPKSWSGAPVDDGATGR